MRLVPNKKTPKAIRTGIRYDSGKYALKPIDITGSSSSLSMRYDDSLLIPDTNFRSSIAAQWTNMFINKASKEFKSRVISKEWLRRPRPRLVISNSVIEETHMEKKIDGTHTLILSYYGHYMPVKQQYSIIIH